MSQLQDDRRAGLAPITPIRVYPEVKREQPPRGRRTESSACLGVIIALAVEVAAGLIFVALVGTLLALLKAVGL